MTDVRWVKGGTGRGASTLELFFDLVYVFAITQVASLMRAEPNITGLAKGGFVLLMLWWTWSLYTWTTNWLGTSATGTRLALLSAMGATLLLAKTVPDAFGDGSFWFGLTYFVVRMISAAMYWFGAKDVAGQRAALLTFLPLSVLGAALVLGGGFFAGGVRLVMWVGAVIVDMASAAAAGRGTWAVDAHHFAERNGLFVIIALGESIVSIGIASVGGERDLVHFVSLTAAFAGVAALWWSYFDRVAPYAEAYFESAGDRERGRFARDAYTILHFPLVLGIVLYAVAAEEVVAHPEEHLTVAGRVSLAMGAALVLLALILSVWRTVHRVPAERLLATIALVLLVVLGGPLSAAVFTGVVVVILVVTLAVERSQRWPELAVIEQ
jgi:low temperature requirement protein LtrA